MVDGWVLALDFGAGAGRAMLVPLGGGAAISVQREWVFEVDPGGGPGALRFDPGYFWAKLVDAVREVVVRANIGSRDVRSVACTSIRQGFVLLDKDGQEVFAVPNRDARAVAEASDLAESFGVRMNAASGHWPSEIMVASRLLWLERHEPQTLACATSLLMINDWMQYRLTNARHAEPTNAAETCFLDLATRRWDRELIAAAGCPLDIFPEIVDGGTVVGHLTPRAAEETGLLKGTPVVAAGADSQCALLGMGLRTAGPTGIVAGTSTPVQRLVESPVIDSNARSWSSPSVVPGTWVVESNAGATGSGLRWLRDTFWPCSSEGEDTRYDEIELEATAADAEGLTVLMGARIMNARRVVANDPARLAGILVSNARAELMREDSRGRMARALLESLAFAVWANARQLDDIAGPGNGRVVVCGGTAQSRLWLQMVADLFERPVERAGQREATSLGAAICAAAGTEYGTLADAAAALVPPPDLIEPTATEGLGGRLQRWLEFQS